MIQTEVCPVCGLSGDLVGTREIANRLGKAIKTVQHWRQRDMLPAPLAVLAGGPVWSWPTIAGWAADTGRLPS